MYMYLFYRLSAGQDHWIDFYFGWSAIELHDMTIDIDVTDIFIARYDFISMKIYIAINNHVCLIIITRA